MLVRVSHDSDMPMLTVVIVLLDSWCYSVLSSGRVCWNGCAGKMKGLCFPMFEIGQRGQGLIMLNMPVDQDFLIATPHECAGK